MKLTVSSLFSAATLLLCSACAPGSDTVSEVDETAGGVSVPAGVDVVYDEHVAPLLDRHCTGCHRANAIAPFALTSYDAAARHIERIVEATTEREMPPWLPSTRGLPLDDERLLTQAEIELFQRWQAGGLERGGTAEPGEHPQRSEWELGTPDLVVEMPSTFAVPASGPDIFRNFVIPFAEAAGRSVSAYEFQPGNRRVVHHANVLADTSGRARVLDNEDATPGYSGMAAAIAPGGHFMGWTPGKRPRALPDGTAWTVAAGTDLVVQLHLMPSGREETVRSRVGFYFSDREPRRNPVVLHLGSTRIDLPAGSRDVVVRDEWTLPYAVRLAAIYPHAHYLGSSITLTSHDTAGAVTTLLDIPRWDFFWQDEYRLRDETVLPAGTRLELAITYDNSADNPRNPHDPPRDVSWGPASFDEMADVWITAFPVEPRDLVPLRRSVARRDLEIARPGLVDLVERIGSTASHARLAGLDLALNRYAEALQGFERALGGLGPSGEPTFVAQLGHDRGLALVGMGRHRPASHSFSGAADTLDPKDRTHRELRASALGNLGGTLLVLGELDAAAAALSSALDLKPEDARSIVRLGLVASRRGELEQAERSYREALDLAPEQPDAWSNLGALLLRTGRVTEGTAALERAIELEPQLSEAHKNLASLAALEGDLPEARRRLERALQIDPNDPALHHLLGMTALQLGDRTAAHASFAAALERDPSYVPAHRDWATLLTLDGDHARALDHWRAATKGAPEDDEAALQYAKSLVRARQIDEALDIFSRLSQEARSSEIRSEATRVLTQLDDSARDARRPR